MQSKSIAATVARSTGREPIIVFDRQHGEGILHEAEGHNGECWEQGCSECQLHADGCPCGLCVEFHELRGWPYTVTVNGGRNGRNAF